MTIRDKVKDKFNISGASVDVTYVNLGSSFERCIFYICVAVVACTWIVYR